MGIILLLVLSALLRLCQAEWSVVPTPKCNTPEDCFFLFLHLRVKPVPPDVVHAGEVFEIKGPVTWTSSSTNWLVSVQRVTLRNVKIENIFEKSKAAATGYPYNNKYNIDGRIDTEFYSILPDASKKSVPFSGEYSLNGTLGDDRLFMEGGFSGSVQISAHHTLLFRLDDKGFLEFHSNSTYWDCTITQITLANWFAADEPARDEAWGQLAVAMTQLIKIELVARISPILLDHITSKFKGYTMASIGRGKFLTETRPTDSTMTPAITTPTRTTPTTTTPTTTTPTTTTPTTTTPTTTTPTTTTPTTTTPTTTTPTTTTPTTTTPTTTTPTTTTPTTTTPTTTTPTTTTPTTTTPTTTTPTTSTPTTTTRTTPTTTTPTTPTGATPPTTITRVTSPTPVTISPPTRITAAPTAVTLPLAVPTVLIDVDPFRYKGNDIITLTPEETKPISVPIWSMAVIKQLLEQVLSENNPTTPTTTTSTTPSTSAPREVITASEKPAKLTIPIESGRETETGQGPKNDKFKSYSNPFLTILVNQFVGTPT